MCSDIIITNCDRGQFLNLTEVTKGTCGKTPIQWTILQTYKNNSNKYNSNKCHFGKAIKLSKLKALKKQFIP